LVRFCRFENGLWASVLPVNVLQAFSFPDLPDKKFFFVLALAACRRRSGSVNIESGRISHKSRAADNSPCAAPL
jgi:hypothetical protein